MQPPPSNEATEQAALAAMISMEECREIGITTLMTDDFYLPQNKIIFEVIKKLGMVDHITLFDELRASKQMDKAGGMDYIMLISQRSYDTISMFDAYCDTLREAHRNRQLYDIAREIAQQVLNGGVSEKTIEGTRAALDAIKPEIKVPADKLVETLEKGQQEVIDIKIRRKETGQVCEVTTGIADLDRSTPPMPKRLFVVAGVSGMGKTTFALNMILKNSLVGVPGAFFSLEMDKTTIGQNMIINLLKLDNEKAHGGYLNDEEIQSVVHYNSRNHVGFIRDMATTTINQIASEVRRLKKEHDIKYAIVDYLQRIIAPGRDIRERVINVTIGLAACAKENDIHVLALAQPNRAPENREDRRPRMSDLAESSQIEKEAAAVIMLYRDFIYNSSANPHKMELIVRKNRFGRERTAQAYCDMSKYLITNQY